MYAMRARIAYMNYAKKLRIFNILNLFYVVYIYYEGDGVAEQKALNIAAELSPRWRLHTSNE